MKTHGACSRPPLRTTARPWTAWPIHTVDQSPTVDRARRHRTDRRRGARHDAFCRARCGDGDRGCGDAGRRACPQAEGPGSGASRLGKGEAAAHRPGCAPGRAQPLCLACRGAGRHGAQPVLRCASPEKLAADLDWLYGWEPPALKPECASIVQLKRHRQRLRQTGSTNPSARRPRAAHPRSSCCIRPAR